MQEYVHKYFDIPIYFTIFNCRVDQTQEIERNKNIINLGSYLREKISKIQAQITKVAKQTQAMERNKLLFEYMKGKELTDIKEETTIYNLIEMINSKLHVGSYRLRHMKEDRKRRGKSLLWDINDAYDPSTPSEDFLYYASYAMESKSKTK